MSGVSDELSPRRARGFAQDGAVVAVVLQAITWLSFACMLDGHVRLRACTWCLLAYGAAVAVLLAAARGRPLGRLEWAFVVTGWVPLVAAGIPALLWLWRAAGYI